MAEIAKGRTVFIIAHRSVDGPLRRPHHHARPRPPVEDGTHDELMQPAAATPSLHRLQAGIHEVR